MTSDIAVGKSLRALRKCHAHTIVQYTSTKDSTENIGVGFPFMPHVAKMEVCTLPSAF